LRGPNALIKVVLRWDMKFELNPYNRDLKDDELLNDLRFVAQQLAKDYVTKDEYNKLGRLCAATFQKRFGSWGKANELAGLRRIMNFQATSEDCIADIKRVAALLGIDCITTDVYKTHGGNFSLPLISKRVGSWKSAIEQAGLNLSPHYNDSITDDELFENLEQLWERLGRQPTTKDFIRPLSLYSYSTYPRRFGSYRKALEAFVSSFQNEAANQKQIPEQVSLANQNKLPSLIIHKTSRTISWRLRFLVMRRDDFKCRFDGKSPATHTGTILEVDHIIPWAEGGETVMENLQTLCQQCNGGKSNLSMNED
jgi:hypothetical protein